MPKIELNELNTIVNSSALLRILNKHKVYLQGKVNSSVREQKWIEAYAYLGRMEDFDKILDLIKQEISNIEKGEK